jgi:hypothetical protein
MDASIVIPDFVTHYYRGQPFRTLTVLDSASRSCVIDALDYPPEASHRFHSPHYFEQRLRYEAIMYEQFVAKGGQPTLHHPHYAVLGESEIWAAITTQSLRIPLSAISSGSISFTYTDSWVTYVDREPNGDVIPRKPQYDMLYPNRGARGALCKIRLAGKQVENRIRLEKRPLCRSPNLER